MKDKIRNSRNIHWTLHTHMEQRKTQWKSYTHKRWVRLQTLMKGSICTNSVNKTYNWIIISPKRITPNMMWSWLPSSFFSIWIVGGGVHTGSTRHCGHYWPTVPAPGDSEDGEVGGMNGFGRGNRSTRRKPAMTPLYSPQIPLARPGCEPGPRRWEARH
jgi:hypothetical protein